MADAPVDAHALKLFEAASKTFNGKVQNDQLMCRIYEAYAGPEDANHNCLGCNLDAVTDQISKFLHTAATGASGFNAEEAFSVYALLVNTLWERITDVFDIVSVPDSYRKRHYRGCDTHNGSCGSHGAEPCTGSAADLPLAHFAAAPVHS